MPSGKVLGLPFLVLGSVCYSEHSARTRTVTAILYTRVECKGRIFEEHVPHKSMRFIECISVYKTVFLVCLMSVADVFSIKIVIAIHPAGGRYTRGGCAPTLPVESWLHVQLDKTAAKRLSIGLLIRLLNSWYSSRQKVSQKKRLLNR